MGDEKLVNLRSDIADHLVEIADMFEKQPKITIIIRTPWLEDGGVLISDDDYDLAVAEIQRLRGKRVIGSKP